MRKRAMDEGKPQSIPLDHHHTVIPHACSKKTGAEGGTAPSLGRGAVRYKIMKKKEKTDTMKGKTNRGREVAVKCTNSPGASFNGTGNTYETV